MQYNYNSNQSVSFLEAAEEARRRRAARGGSDAPSAEFTPFKPTVDPTFSKSQRLDEFFSESGVKRVDGLRNKADAKDAQLLRVPVSINQVAAVQQLVLSAIKDSAPHLLAAVARFVRTNGSMEALLRNYTSRAKDMSAGSLTPMGSVVKVPPAVLLGRFPVMSWEEVDRKASTDFYKIEVKPMGPVMSFVDVIAPVKTNPRSDAGVMYRDPLDMNTPVKRGAIEDRVFDDAKRWFLLFKDSKALNAHLASYEGRRETLVSLKAKFEVIERAKWNVKQRCIHVFPAWESTLGAALSWRTWKRVASFPHNERSSTIYDVSWANGGATEFVHRVLDLPMGFHTKNAGDDSIFIYKAPVVQHHLGIAYLVSHDGMRAFARPAAVQHLRDANFHLPVSALTEDNWRDVRFTLTVWCPDVRGCDMSQQQKFFAPIFFNMLRSLATAAPFDSAAQLAGFDAIAAGGGLLAVRGRKNDIDAGWRTMMQFFAMRWFTAEVIVGTAVLAPVNCGRTGDWCTTTFNNIAVSCVNASIEDQMYTEVKVVSHEKFLKQDFNTVPTPAQVTAGLDHYMFRRTEGMLPANLASCGWVYKKETLEARTWDSSSGEPWSLDLPLLGFTLRPKTFVSHGQHTVFWLPRHRDPPRIMAALVYCNTQEDSASLVPRISILMSTAYAVAALCGYDADDPQHREFHAICAKVWKVASDVAKDYPVDLDNMDPIEGLDLGDGHPAADEIKEIARRARKQKDAGQSVRLPPFPRMQHFEKHYLPPGFVADDDVASEAPSEASSYVALEDYPEWDEDDLAAMPKAPKFEAEPLSIPARPPAKYPLGDIPQRTQKAQEFAIKKQQWAVLVEERRRLRDLANTRADRMASILASRGARAEEYYDLDVADQDVREQDIKEQQEYDALDAEEQRYLQEEEDFLASLDDNERERYAEETADFQKHKQRRAKRAGQTHRDRSADDDFLVGVETNPGPWCSGTIEDVEEFTDDAVGVQVVHLYIMWHARSWPEVLPRELVYYPVGLTPQKVARLYGIVRSCDSVYLAYRAAFNGTPVRTTWTAVRSLWAILDDLTRGEGLTRCSVDHFFVCLTTQNEHEDPVGPATNQWNNDVVMMGLTFDNDYHEAHQDVLVAFYNHALETGARDDSGDGFKAWLVRQTRPYPDVRRMAALAPSVSATLLRLLEHEERGGAFNDFFEPPVQIPLVGIEPNPGPRPAYIPQSRWPAGMLQPKRATVLPSTVCAKINEALRTCDFDFVYADLPACTVLLWCARRVYDTARLCWALKGAPPADHCTMRNVAHQAACYFLVGKQAAVDRFPLLWCAAQRGFNGEPFGEYLRGMHDEDPPRFIPMCEFFDYFYDPDFVLLLDEIDDAQVEGGGPPPPVPEHPEGHPAALDPNHLVGIEPNPGPILSCHDSPVHHTTVVSMTTPDDMLPDPRIFNPPSDPNQDAIRDGMNSGYTPPPVGFRYTFDGVLKEWDGRNWRAVPAGAPAKWWNQPVMPAPAPEEPRRPKPGPRTNPVAPPRPAPKPGKPSIMPLQPPHPRYTYDPSSGGFPDAADQANPFDALWRLVTHKKRKKALRGALRNKLSLRDGDPASLAAAALTEAQQQDARASGDPLVPAAEFAAVPAAVRSEQILPGLLPFKYQGKNKFVPRARSAARPATVRLAPAARSRSMTSETPKSQPMPKKNKMNKKKKGGDPLLKASERAGKMMLKAADQWARTVAFPESNRPVRRPDGSSKASSVTQIEANFTLSTVTPSGTSPPRVAGLVFYPSRPYGCYKTLSSAAYVAPTNTLTWSSANNMPAIDATPSMATLMRSCRVTSAVLRVNNTSKISDEAGAFHIARFAGNADSNGEIAPATDTDFCAQPYTSLVPANDPDNAGLRVVPFFDVDNSISYVAPSTTANTANGVVILYRGLTAQDQTFNVKIIMNIEYVPFASDAYLLRPQLDLGSEDECMKALQAVWPTIRNSGFTIASADRLQKTRKMRARNDAMPALVADNLDELVLRAHAFLSESGNCLARFEREADGKTITHTCARQVHSIAAQIKCALSDLQNALSGYHLSDGTAMFPKAPELPALYGDEDSSVAIPLPKKAK